MNKLSTLKCFEVTSQTQANNGTICYHDPITNADYLSYENGYIRRAYTKKSYYGHMQRSIYQLNPQRKAYGEHYDSIERIMVPDPQERFDLLAKAVVNYRKTVKSYKKN